MYTFKIMILYLFYPYSDVKAIAFLKPEIVIPVLIRIL